MKASDTSVLAYALLGLIQRKPSSGYDLRKVFAETAMGNYSSSPGGIYPALDRLESQQLIFGVLQDTAGMRRRRLYRVTAKGNAALKKWLTRSIAQSDIKREVPELMLRFAFMDQALGIGSAIVFLEEFRAALQPYVSGLEAYLKANAKNMPLSGSLALECGIRSYRSLYDWATHAIRVYRKAKTTPTSRSPKPAEGGRS